MKKSAYSVAVVGATGLVGGEIIAALAERAFPVGDLQLYASLHTAGEEVSCGALTVRVAPLDGAHFADTDIVFFAAGEQVSAEWITRATEAGAIAIDTSPLLAEDPDVLLVVPEVNAADVSSYADRGVIVSPDAVAIALAVALKPLHDVATITRIVVSTFEPVSGAGRAGIEELQQQTVELMSGRSIESAVFPQRIAFNALPQIGVLLAGGRTRDEQTAVSALRRLLGDAELPVSITRVRAPLFYGTAVSVNIETATPLTAADARELLRVAPGVLVQDADDEQYPTPADAVGQDATFIGRIRDDESANVLDNTRKGAAVNAVQIAERLIRDYV